MIGTTLKDRYELLEELGRGGMGVVYRARDPLLDREVAIKLVPPLRFDEEMAERFQREAQVVARMDHPAIVTIHDYGRHDDALFFVMPLLHGTTLRQLIEERGLRLGEVVSIGAQVADALDYSHTRGILHRDVKPENVMVARERGGLRVRVMDFGLARDTEDPRLTLTGSLVGTPAYLSPEQVEGRAVDHRADLYSLGVVLYECLAGQPPFTGAVHQTLSRIAAEPPPPLADSGVTVSAELERIVLSCLAKKPEERPASGKELAEALTACWGSLRESERSRPMVLAGRRAAGPPLPPLVGRDAELAELQARLDKALAGECQLVLVGGGVGTGKTRLLQEIEVRAESRGVMVLHGRFADPEGASPYQGLCELIEDYFRSPEAEGREVPLADLAADLVALFPSLSEIEAVRAAAVGEARLPAPAEGRHGSGSTYVFELLARTLARLADDRPMALLLQHLHLGEVAIEALRYVVRRLGPTPTLLVGTYRPGDLPKGHPLRHFLRTLGDDPRAGSVLLGPLRGNDFRQLVEVLVGSPKLQPELVDWLYEATEGNPLFTHELVRSLTESGEIRRDESGSWVRAARAHLSAQTLPATIQQVIEQRIEHLPAAEQRLLSVAAVLGKSFDERDLEELLGSPPELDESLDELLRQGLLQEEPDGRGERLSFPSGVVRDVLYGALPRRRRRHLHRRHARWLERRHAGRLDRVLPQLVHHFYEGDAAEETVGYALDLARRLLDSWSPEDAVRVSKKALELVDEGEVEGSAARRGELWSIVARSLHAMGRTAGALRRFELALDGYRAAGDEARAAEVALFAARVAWQGRRPEEARRWVDEGVELARRDGRRAGHRAGHRDGHRDGRRDVLRELLTLGATEANLRGDHQEARLFLDEAEGLAPGGAPAAEPIPAGGTLVTALPGPVVSLEPGAIHTDWEEEVAATLFETLLRCDGDGRLSPWLCARWRSRDGDRRFEVELRPEARFSDGRPLTAADVAGSFRRAARNAGYTPPAAFAAIEGFAEYLRGEAEEVPGIEVDPGPPERVTFRLTEPLPIFPALLADPGTAVARESEGGLLGTGPFVLAEHGPEGVRLERNPGYWRDTPPLLDAVELRAPMDAAGIAAGLRTGEVDLGRDLAPEELEELLRDPRFQGGLAEATKKNVYFVLFNVAGPGEGAPVREAVREAMIGVIRPRDLVWRTLGRFAQPAVGLIPPGILGHDPGRRLSFLGRERAAERLREAGVSTPLRLRAAVHPLLSDRYGALLEAVLGEWRTLGIEVTVETPTQESYARRLRDGVGVDLLLGRWNADYDDPDNFTHYLFHGRDGRLRHYFSSSRADRLLERARRESRDGERQLLYQKFENLLARERVLLPLFHDVDYRLAAPSVRGLRLSSSPPYVDYRRVGKVAGAPARRRSRGGEIHAPVSGRIETLDPVATTLLEYAEVIPNVFETLTRVDDEARIVPWLASELRPQERGRAYRFRLRPGVSFHDGRRLTVRDVRWSFERVLRIPRDDLHLPPPPILGARELREGTAAELEGFRILSSDELVIELEQPLAFFPALLTHPCFSIVPEGAEGFDGRWRDGCVGTGPFRVVRFDRGERLDLEKNPHYWRPGYPRSQRLVFHSGMAPERVVEELRVGRLSLATDLRPADVEALRRDPAFAAGYREAPRLSTYFLAMNRRSGPLGELRRRRALAAALEVEPLLAETLGRLAVRAHGLIPPGLLGYEEPREEAPAGADPEALRGLRLRVAVNPAYTGLYGSFWERLRSTLEERLGVELEVLPASAPEVIELAREGEVELKAQRWIPDFPDADNIAMGLLHSREGALAGLLGAPEIDRRIEQGRRETDPALRHAIYRELEELLAREALVIPLFHEQSYRFAHPDLRGLKLGLSLPEVRYEELSSRSG